MSSAAGPAPRGAANAGAANAGSARGAAPFAIPPFPWPVRAGLAAWRAVARTGLARPALDEASIVAAARRATGLHSFVDERFRVRMRQLLFSLEEEAGLHLLGRAVVRASIVRALACRLRLENLCDLHPEIGALPVEAPVFIAGLQRTGTTKLHRLLACDPRLRPLISAEGLNPAPLGRPVRDEPGERARRMAQARTAERGMRYMSPALFAIHPIEADAPEEDVFLLDVAFVSGAIDASLDVPTYSQKLRESPQHDAYAYFRRLVQLLLWQRPGRYVGKTPHHLENLDALLAAFPDAKVLHTHRDPRKVVPSFASMMVHAGAMLSSSVDPHRTGRRVAAQAARSIDRALSVRDALGPRDTATVLDIHYASLQRDPFAEMHRVYAFLGLALTPDVEGRMRAWLRDNPQGKNGAHHYRARDFGLDEAELDARFKAYRERFGIPAE